MVESNALEMTERHLGSPNHRSNAGEATKEHGSGIGNQVRPGKAWGGGREEPREHAKWMTSPLCSPCSLCNFPDCGDPSRLWLTYVLVTHTESSHRPAPRTAPGTAVSHIRNF